MFAEQELSLISQFQEQELFPAKTSFDETMVELMSVEKKCNILLSQVITGALSIPLLTGVNVHGVMGLVYGGIFTAMIVIGIWPVGMFLGQTDLGKTLGRLLFKKKFKRFDELELEVLIKKNRLRDIILTEEAKDFFSGLYLFLEKKLMQEGILQVPGAKPTPTFNLFQRIKNIIEAYTMTDPEEMITDVIYHLKDSEEDIKTELNKSVDLKKFLHQRSKPKKLNNYATDTDSLFKKSKYEL